MDVFDSFNLGDITAPLSVLSQVVKKLWPDLCIEVYLGVKRPSLIVDTGCVNGLFCVFIREVTSLGVPKCRKDEHKLNHVFPNLAVGVKGIRQNFVEDRLALCLI